MLKNSRKPAGRFGFLGVGQHSLANLYPCLRYLNVDVQLIYSHTLANAKAVAESFPGAKATDNLQAVIENPGIDGIFICLRPEDQYNATLKALSNNKHVFVEKPPCGNAAELEKLIGASTGRICFPALQRRYSTVYDLVKKNNFVSQALSYTYHFRTGLFPDGDPLTELFLHPLDLIIHLFGDTRQIHFQKTIDGGTVVYQLLLEHQSGLKGSVELSSAYTWNSFTDHMTIITRHKVVQIQYPHSLKAEKKSEVFNLPLEKIIRQPKIDQVYFDQMNLSTLSSSNTLVTQGFMKEIESFLESIYKEQDDHTGLESLRPVYKLIEQLR